MMTPYYQDSHVTIYHLRVLQLFTIFSCMDIAEARQYTAAQRSRLRKRSIDVPKLSPGPPKGYKQTEEHINKKKRYGAAHWAWKGEDIVPKSGRTRAGRRFEAQPCSQCGTSKAERHHKDGNPKNNYCSNVTFLCRRCHMIADGRMASFVQLAKENQPNAVAARWR